jgi:hypothetical protein
MCCRLQFAVLKAKRGPAGTTTGLTKTAVLQIASESDIKAIDVNDMTMYVQLPVLLCCHFLYCHSNNYGWHSARLC